MAWSSYAWLRNTRRVTAGSAVVTLRTLSGSGCIGPATVADSQEAAARLLGAACDAFSNRIVGWKTGDRCDTDLVLGALEYATFSREVRDGQLIHHSDKGSNAADSTRWPTAGPDVGPCSAPSMLPLPAPALASRPGHEPDLTAAPARTRAAGRW